MNESGGQGRTLAVCVPARDEAARLPALLEALSRQVAVPATRVILAFLFDDCTDASEAIVRRAGAAMRMPIVTARSDLHGAPNAGRARAAAMALGAAAIADAAPALLLSTDADSVPAPDWIAANIRALADADVVAGRIVRQAAAHDPAAGRLEAYYERIYALRRMLDPVPWEPAPAHHYASGASLGFRADAYAALSGFAELGSGEDGEIVDRAQRAGLRVRRDPAIVVETSSRRQGRAPGGLAAMLRRLDRDGLAASVRVAHPAGATWQYRAHAAARAAFPMMADAMVATRLAGMLGADAGALRALATAVPNAEAFAIRVVPAPPGGEHLVSLDEAWAALGPIEAGGAEQAA